MTILMFALYIITYVVIWIIYASFLHLFGYKANVQDYTILFFGWNALYLLMDIKENMKE